MDPDGHGSYAQLLMLRMIECSAAALNSSVAVSKAAREVVRAQSNSRRTNKAGGS